MNKTLLQINVVVNYGSTGRIAEEIGQAAINNGWKSYIAYGRYDRPSKSNLIKIGSTIDTYSHVIQTRLFDRHGLASKQATIKLIEQIQIIKPSVIHLHNLHGYYINIEILFDYLAIANIPIVWTLHDCWPMTGHCSYFDYIGCNKWETGCFHCPQKKKYPSSFGLDRSKQNYFLKKRLFTSVKQMTLIPVSQWLGNIVQKSYLKDFPLQVINNGIDTRIFKPLNNNFIRTKYHSKGKFIILGVANIWEIRKGLADFIKLSTLLDEKFQILLVGLTNKQIEELPKNIIGITRTESTKELAELYSMADVYVNTSVEETFGLTTAEALACGTPVVVIDATANPELVTSKTGLVVAKKDIAGLLNAIQTVCRNGKEYYSKACRQRAVEKYDKNDRYLDYIKLYQSYLIK